MRIIITITIVMLLCGTYSALAQFSPGDLSRAHAQLEGMNHCSDCHEVGKEISGAKCLGCHKEIKSELDARRGYHFSVASSSCITCHKEHLGISAQITIFDRTRFDHSKTGFSLTGKHATKACDDCHTARFIKNPDVATMHRKTSLGLSAACVACHEDRHKGALGTDCNTCHTTTAFKPASNFDHARTKFALVGKHRDVACNKCHTERNTGAQSATAILGTKTFADCTPCHQSPHNAKFAAQSCSSCHTPNDWKDVRGQKFNHDLTDFRLRGKHALVKCQQCHKPDSRISGGRALKMPHSRCTDCHADHHQGEFTARYGKDCARCHTVDGYTPSTFTLDQHASSRFPLKGSHAAVPCARCHAQSSGERSLFRFASLKCESCHKDPHNGQFRKIMGDAGCVKCHSTDEWKSTTFDHAQTAFSLAGKHATISCSSCHQPQGKNGVVQYKGLASSCDKCHAEPHARQFATNGSTNCTLCHSAEGWKLLLFDHTKQSAFALTGAHLKVACQSCHKEEKREGQAVVRFKPLSSRCESCHGQKEMKHE
jgi:hypothetical protein